MEEGIFPGVQSMHDREEMQEERRLAYVAITRAKERLYLTRAHSRLLYGRTQLNPLSPFMREIPSHLLVEEDDNAPTFGTRRTGYSGGYAGQTRPAASYGSTPRAPGLPGDFFRRANVSGTAAAPKAAQKPKTPAMLATGTRVRHATFGTGKILSAREMGGDVLYEVTFDNGQTKKLMATFAKLTPIE
jgi:DNA helicase-2/ATP-dependent DNA helicase PcrA